MSTPLPPLAQIPPHVVAVSDYEALARERMTPQAWAWLEGGAADEQTLRDNRDAYARLRLQNRVLAELSGGDSRLELFGQTFEHPILVAPVAFQRLAHPDGERATVLAAGALKAGMVVSTQSSIPVEELAREAAAPLWFQLYLQPEREHSLALLRRAEAAGCGAVVVTVDAPVNSPRNREQRAGFSLPPGVEAVHLRGMPGLPPQTAHAGGNALLGTPLLAAAPSWRDIEWLRGQTRLPLLLKGVLSPRDARRALEHGIDGLVVSNHGGRSLDSLPATLEALPAIAQAVRGEVPLLLDGGIRRGTDVLKALALGASAVMVGRPCLHGLATAGAVGVAHVLHILRVELEIAMALCGCRRLADIGPEVLFPQH